MGVVMTVVAEGGVSADVLVDCVVLEKLVLVACEGWVRGL